MNPDDQQRSIDLTALSWGLVIGFLAGALLTLFKAPRNVQGVRQQLDEAGTALLERIEAAIPADPIVQGLAEGKAAARRRRAELGLPNSS